MKTIIEVLIALINILYQNHGISFDYGKELIEKLNEEYKKQSNQDFNYDQEMIDKLQEEENR